MKKIIAFCIALVLLTGLTAAAAPTRNRQLPVENLEMIAQIQPLADVVAAAAWRQGITLYRNGTAPEQALMEGVLLEALQSQLLVYDAQDQNLSLTDGQVQHALDQLFYYQDLPGMKTPIHQSITASDQGLRFNLGWQQDYIGAFIYHIGLSEDEVLAMADIYQLSGIQTTAEEAPEESLTWLAHMGFRFKSEPDSPLGFTLASFSVPEVYQARGFLQFEVEDLFEVQYPDLFTEGDAIEGAYLALKSEDGSSQLHIYREPGTVEDVKTAWVSQSPGDGTVSLRVREDGRLVYYSNGENRLAVYDPINGEDSCLVLTLVFSNLKPHEYELYFQFLDNSFVVYSDAFG